VAIEHSAQIVVAMRDLLRYLVPQLQLRENNLRLYSLVLVGHYALLVQQVGLPVVQQFGLPVQQAGLPVQVGQAQLNNTPDCMTVNRSRDIQEGKVQRPFLHSKPVDMLDRN